MSTLEIVSIEDEDGATYTTVDEAKAEAESDPDKEKQSEETVWGSGGTFETCEDVNRGRDQRLLLQRQLGNAGSGEVDSTVCYQQHDSTGFVEQCENGTDQTGELSSVDAGGGEAEPELRHENATVRQISEELENQIDGAEEEQEDPVVDETRRVKKIWILWWPLTCIYLFRFV